MRLLLLTSIALVCTLAVHTLTAADDLIEQLATCKVSWLDWKNDPVKTKKLAESFNAAFTEKTQKAGGRTFVPKRNLLIVGLPVAQAFPDSVGMGVGFSVTLNASFDKARQAAEKSIGKTLKDCETSDGMRMCGLDIAEKRTLMLMAAENGKSQQTLLGCYYFYAK